MSTIINQPKSAPFSSIHIPEEENARIDLTNIEELAASIKTHGLLQSLTVTNGGSENTPYRLVAGFRRAAALKLLKWGDKDVPVVVVQAQGRAIKNLVENIHRDALPDADLAARLHDLFTGDYPREKGEEVIEYTKERLAAETGLSVSHITNLIRAHSNLAPEVKKAWRKHRLPQNLIFKCASMVEKVEEEVEVLDARGKKVKDEEGNVKTTTRTVKVPDEKGQERLMTKWAAAKEKEELAAKGKKLTSPAAEGGEGGEEGERGGGSVEADGKKPGKKQLFEFIDKAKENLKALAEGSVEHSRLKGKLEGVQWAAGDRAALAPRG